LQRRLFEAGTTFEELREQVREDLAVKYVQQSNLRLAEISEILGYSLFPTKRVQPRVQAIAGRHAPTASGDAS
jgi:hypothetical protein